MDMWEGAGRLSEHRALSDVWVTFRFPESNVLLGTNRHLISRDIFV